MSIDSVLARMNALQGLMDSASGAVAPATDNTAAFSAAMNAAAAATGTSTNANANFANLASPIGTATIAGATDTTATGGASALPAGTPYGPQITAPPPRNGLDPPPPAGPIKQEAGFKANAPPAPRAPGPTPPMPGPPPGP